jgi:hypothetical protein
MPSKETPPECFICTESEPRPHRSVCLCTDRHVHTECFVKMLKAQNGDCKCRVCGALYGDVGWRTRRVVQWTSPFGIVVMMTCCAIALAGCAINTAMVVQHMHPKHNAMVWIAIMLMIAGCIGSAACVVETIRRFGWGAVWASRVAEEKVIVVRAARLPERTTPTELGELAT